MLTPFKGSYVSAGPAWCCFEGLVLKLQCCERAEAPCPGINTDKISIPNCPPVRKPALKPSLEFAGFGAAGFAGAGFAAAAAVLDALAAVAGNAAAAWASRFARPWCDSSERAASSGGPQVLPSSELNDASSGLSFPSDTSASLPPGSEAPDAMRWE